MQLNIATHHSRLLVAPLLGALGGFLLNRARGGAEGYGLFFEMLAGVALVTFGAWVVNQFNRMLEEQSRARARQQHSTVAAALVAAEAEAYQFRRALIERALKTERAVKQLASRPASDLNVAMARIEALEHENRLAREARQRLAAIEAAQESLRAEQLELGLRASKEAEEVKASLLEFTVTESQRRRNLEAPENDQSGRIIELEARIQRLAREIERLSSRQGATGTDGNAGTEQQASQARMGFLRAMLDANKTLRDNIREAA